MTVAIVFVKTTRFAVLHCFLYFINADYCWSLHEDYYIRHTVYCSNGSCFRDCGEGDKCAALNGVSRISL